MNPRVLYRAASYATDARAAADSVISALTPAAWYRNATGVTESGGFASQWDDYSGNGRHLVQATGTNQPAYSAGVLTFDGVDNFMQVVFAQSQPWSVYLVMEQSSWTGGNRFIGGGTDLKTEIIQSNASPELYIYAGGDTTASNNNLALGSYGIVCAVYNGASSSLRVNNTAKTTGNPGAVAPGGITLGCRGGVMSSFGDGSFKEVVCFSAAHDDATQSSVITSLNNALTVF